MIIPSFLQKGDTVAIIATARKISQEEITPAVAFLESYGLNVLLGNNLFETDNQYAGTDRQRAEDLHWAIYNKDVKAIIIARGGYGTVKIIEHLNFREFKNHPKWIVGDRDVTVLHSAAYNMGIASLHATMPINFFKNKEASESLMNKLFGKMDPITVEPHVI